MQSSSTPVPDPRLHYGPNPEESEFDTNNHHKVHFYNDGNIILNIQGMLFRVHKCKIFSDMFSLALSPNDNKDVDEVPLHDEPLKFARVLDALYKGMTFILVVTLRNCLDIIELAQKYEMSDLEACFQGWLLGKLPLSAGDALSTPKYFSRYRNDPSLARAVLRYGDSRLHPWAFYSLGIQVTLELDPSDTSTYSTPSPLSSLDGAFMYPLLILQQIITQAFLDWDSRISAFYATPCNKHTLNTKLRTVCSRTPMGFTASTSPLKLSSNEKHKDPVQSMVLRIDALKECLSSHGGIYCTWCPSCIETLKHTAEDVVRNMYSRLLECAALVKRSSVSTGLPS